MWSKWFAPGRRGRGPRPGRPAARPARRALGLEGLEARCTPTVTAGIVNDPHEGRVLLAQCDNTPNTVTVDHEHWHSGYYAVINGQLFNDSSYDVITVAGRSAPTTSDIRANVKPVYVGGYSRHDVANLGDTANTLEGILAPVVLGAWGFDSLTINDQGDGADRTADISGGAVITGLAPAAINGPDAPVGTLTVLGGSGNNTYNIHAVLSGSMTLNTGGGRDTVSVQTAAAPLTVTTTTGTGGGGSDRVTIGNGHLTGFTAPVTVYNGPSFDQVTVDDSADPANHPGVSVTGAGVTGLTWPFAPLNFTSYSVSTLRLRGGGGTNTYTVSGTPARAGVALDTGAGTDTVDVQGASAPLTVNPQGGTDTVNVRGTPAPLDLILQGGVNTVNVRGTSAPLTVNTQGGLNTVNVGSAANSLDPVQGAVTVSGPAGINRVSVNDQGTARGPTYTVTGTGLTRAAGAQRRVLNLSNVFSLSVNCGSGGGGGNVVNVQGNPASSGGLSIASGGGNGAINVTPLRGIGTVSLDGQGGSTTLRLDDQADAADQSYALSAGYGPYDGLAYGPGAFVGYAHLAGLVLNGGGGNDTYTAAAAPAATARAVAGGGGRNTLVGSQAGNSWAISGANAGTLRPAGGGPVSFSGVGSLTAGSGGDTFRFAPAATLSGNLTGGGTGGNTYQFADGASLSGSVLGAGTDNLDYSACNASVIVDLRAGLATGVGGGVSGIHAVVGGTGNGGLGYYNLLIGAGGNYLHGGAGRRNLLVAGGAASGLVGEDQDDLLIGGLTAYDTEAGLASWRQIAAEWAGPDGRATRVAKLTTPGSGVPLLSAATVTGNGGGNGLLGNGEWALIYTDGRDHLSGFGGDQTVTITP
jgi:hypothetical protein